jgi:hypothetical protein
MYLGKPLGEQLLGRPRRSCKVNFRMGRTEISYEDRRWMAGTHSGPYPAVDYGTDGVEP